MFGYRARIGYISPSVIELNAYDFYRIVPKGVGLIGVACMVGGWKGEAYKEALSQVETCARELGRRFCDFIIHGGAPLVLSQGKGFEANLLEKLQRITGVPCTTSIVAAMDAFRDLSASRLAVVDPYPPDLNDKMVKYLKDWGFEVGSVVSLGTSFTESSVASVGDIYRAAKRAVKEAANAQAIFIPCANFPVVDVIEEIETDLGLPVISNITSQLYVAFRAIGMREKIEGFGGLLRML
ncbi:MAG: maleate cis-trans isomerase family protein [Candidatus Binatia bacterium]